MRAGWEIHNNASIRRCATSTTAQSFHRACRNRPVPFMTARSQISATGGHKHNHCRFRSNITQGCTNRSRLGLSRLGFGLGNPVEQPILGHWSWFCCSTRGQTTKTTHENYHARWPVLKRGNKHSCFRCMRLCSKEGGTCQTVEERVVEDTIVFLSRYRTRKKKRVRAGIKGTGEIQRRLII